MKRLVFIAGGICISTMSIFGEVNVGDVYKINLPDVDGNTHATADGRITILVLTNQANTDKAHTLADRVPDFCLGHPTSYRMITVVVLEKKHSRPVRAIFSAVMRHRLDSEARQLQVRYDRLKISRDARHDVFAVADFDGAISAQLDAKFEAGLFRVFVFGRKGELLKRWSDVPSAEDLAAVLKRN